MSDRKKRGGSHSARQKGLVGVVVHLTPAEHETLKRAAEAEGIALKQFVRLAALSVALEEKPISSE